MLLNIGMMILKIVLLCRWKWNAITRQVATRDRVAFLRILRWSLQHCQDCQLQERLSIHITLRWIWAQASLVLTSNSLNSEEQCTDLDLYYSDCTAATAVDRGIALQFTISAWQHSLTLITVLNNFPWEVLNWMASLKYLINFFLPSCAHIVNTSALKSLWKRLTTTPPPLPMW